MDEQNPYVPTPVSDKLPVGKRGRYTFAKAAMLGAISAGVSVAATFLIAWIRIPHPPQSNSPASLARSQALLLIVVLILGLAAALGMGIHWLGRKIHRVFADQDRGE